MQLPRTETALSVNEDGTHQQGPVPGSFDTATEYYKAWAGNIEFGMSKERLRAASGDRNCFLSRLSRNLLAT